MLFMSERGRVREGFGRFRGLSREVGGESWEGLAVDLPVLLVPISRSGKAVRLVASVESERAKSCLCSVSASSAILPPCTLVSTSLANRC